MAAHREAYQAQQHQSDARLKGIHLFTGIDMSEGTLACLYHNCEIMSIPLSSISDVNMVSPTEIEVTIPYENYNEQDDVLCELRFYVPGRDGMLDHIKGKMEGGGNNVAEVLYQEMRRKAKLDDNAGDLIVRLPDLPLVVPRGKYTCDLYRNGVMRLHGNTFGYTVQFRNVVKSFLLPQNDEINTNLVLGFDKPLRQGSTIYPYIIFQFKTNFVHQVETKMPKSELETIHPDLQEVYDGPYYEIVARLFKMIININVIIPGDFVTLNGYKGLKCHVQNQEGTLYPLNKSLIFIRRPVIYIRLEDISRVEFARVSAGHGIRGFDFEVILKNGISSMFSNIDKRELDKVMGYFEKNRILTKTNENLDRANGDDIEYSDDEKKSYKGSDTRYDEDDDDFVAHDEEEGMQPSDAGTGSRARDEDDM